MAAEYLSLAFSTLDYSAQALILVLLVSALWLAPPLSSAGSILRGWLLFVMIMILALCACVDLILRTAVMADVDLSETWNFIPKVLMRSDYGFYWRWRVGVWVVMLLAALWILIRGWSFLSVWLLLIASLVTTLLTSVTGHAGEDGLLTVANMVNWLHLVSISLWGGAVIVYAVVVMPEIRKQGDSGQAATAIGRLSTLATMALGVVLLSGIFNSWRQLNELSELWTTSYGWVLMTKLVLVAIMMLIGALNRFHWVPKLLAWQRDRGESWGAPAHHLLQVLRLDSALFIAILMAAVVLGFQPPPSHNV